MTVCLLQPGKDPVVLQQRVFVWPHRKVAPALGLSRRLPGPGGRGQQERASPVEPAQAGFRIRKKLVKVNARHRRGHASESGLARQEYPHGGPLSRRTPQGQAPRVEHLDDLPGRRQTQPGAV